MLQSIEQQIWQQASLLSDKIAVISGKKSASYKELCQKILGARNFFQNTLLSLIHI